MNLSEQVNQAILVLKGMFKDSEPAPPIPEGMSIETLWVLYQDAISTKKKKQNPGVEEAVKLLLEDLELSEIPIPMIAEIVRETFAAYGLKCKCSESSVRWYQSQRNLEWAIVRRRLPKVEVKDVTKDDPQTPRG
jgi:hypothetical protein